MMLGFEPADKNIMERKPRSSNEKFFNKFLIARIIIPAIIKSAMIASTYFLLESSYSHEISSTVAFIMLAMIELLFAFTVRSDSKTIWQIGISSNWNMFFGVFGVIILQILIVFIPVFMDLLEVVKLTWDLYLMAFGIPLIFFFIAEICKVLLAKTMKK